MEVNTKDNQALWVFWLEQGWKIRKLENPYMASNLKEYRARLKHERKVIEDKGFQEYFLIMSDIIRWAKRNEIAVGPGRGSSAGSLICYLLQITEIDPMQYPMLFERFMDPARTDLPDIDTDFEDERRDEVFAYAARKYGQDRVANIINFVRYKGRNTLDDIARVYHIPSWKIDSIKSKLIERADGHPRALKTIEDTYNSFDDIKEIIDGTEGLKYALDLEGNYRNLNVHAAAMVISSVPMNDMTATYQREIGGQIRWGIAYDKRDATYLGLLKVDILSLKTMGMIARVCNWTLKKDSFGNSYYKKPITLRELYRLDMDDPKVLGAFGIGDVLGIFQFEGTATRRICKAVSPTTFQHLADINALSRPGADEKAYIATKNLGTGKMSYVYVHPIMQEHLEWTYGTFVYEEQILFILRDLGGFKPEELNKMRKIFHDKLGGTALTEYYQRWLKGCAAHGVSAIDAKLIWDTMSNASAYVFNIAHSVSYAKIAYWSQYLKIHYPAAFFASQLSDCADDVRKQKLIAEANLHGIEVLPPDLTNSEFGWEISHDDKGNFVVYAGLLSLDGIGPKTAESIIKWRKESQLLYGEDDWYPEWDDLIEVKGIGKKTIDKIKSFVEQDDPFGVGHVKKTLDTVRRAFNNGELAGIATPTHTSVDLSPEKEFVCFMGIIRKRKYYDAVEQLINRSSEELDYQGALAELSDPHLLKYAALYLEDEHNELVRVGVSRWKYPTYQNDIDNLKIDKDVVLVRGYTNDFAGISIQCKDMVVLEL